jgi:hypothetical protein
MSYSEIMIVNQEGDVEGALELRNSHGTAAMVWGALCRKYKDKIYDTFRGSNPPPPYEMMMWEDLWKATQDGRVELRWWEWNVLNWTYDNALIKGDDLETFVASLRMFEEAHALPGQVCHLLATADYLEGLLKSDRPRATGLYATSVSDNPWWVRGENDDEGRSYNVDRDAKHWFVAIRKAGDPKAAGKKDQSVAQDATRETT